MKSSFVLGLSLLFSTAAGHASGTVVGDGGDPVFAYLEASRFALVATLRDYAVNPPLQRAICMDAQDLDPEQKAFCQTFIKQTFEQFISLNTKKSRTEFVLREEPLLVEGPDGKPMSVAARTQRGPDGVIEFHRPTVLFYGPAQSLLLIAHEFGHKSLFQGRFLSDDEAVGPFPSGRSLLDHAAQAIVALAEKQGRIGRTFGLRDFFRCEVVFSNGQTSRQTGSSPRYFYGSGFDRYQTGVSRTSQDLQIAAGETSSTELKFMIRIEEENGCRADSPAHSGSRQTRLMVLRSFDPLPNGAQKPDELLREISLPGVNPLCQSEPDWLELEVAEVRFRCLYIGTQGTALQ